MININKTIFKVSIILIILILPAMLNAQDMLTPKEYLEMASNRFNKITDFQANIKITIENSETEMEGTYIYKSPNMLRIDFELRRLYHNMKFPTQSSRAPVLCP